MNSIGKKKLIVLSFLALFVFAILFTSSFFKDENHRMAKDDVFILEKGWNIYYEDESIQEADLPIDLDLDAGVIYKAETYLPQEANQMDHLLIRSSMQDVIVYMEDVEIYRHEKLSQGMLTSPPASLWLLVDLPEDFQGKKLTLEVSSELSAFGGVLNEVKMGRAQDLLYNLIKSQFTGLIVFVVLFLTGFLIAIFSVFIRVAKDNRLLYLGLLSMSASVWILSEARLMQFVTGNRFILGGISYMMIPVIGVFLSLYIKDAVLVKDKSKKIATSISIFQGMLIIAILFFQLSGLGAFLSTARYMNLLMTISIFMIVIIMFYELKTYSNVNVSRMLKYTVVMAISTLLEIIAFYSNLFKYTSSFYRVGLLIFIGLLVYDAYTYLKENLEQNRENLLLEKLAYMDFLTGGNNRTAYERDLDKYLESGVFRLVLLDLNDLKYINDTFGHNFGDDAIKTVYRLTREVFKNLGECYRIGGDEFVVLMNSPDKEIYEKCIEKLRDGLEKKKSESAYPIDFAAGSDVYEKENWDSYSEFYHHVDQNMYVDKINRKKSSEIIAM
ncbi:MAG TPA: hypothetical protein DCG38_05625 [Eubacteriaceae bacterium]|nr:hypothetical protein [Eubacteriaceae bacterium]